MIAQDERVLLIKGKGGFGNRMLAATTGLILAELTGRRPVIDWRDGIFLPVGTNLYPLMFDAPDRCDPERFDEAPEVDPPIWNGQVGERPGTMIDKYFPGQHRNPLVYRKLSLNLADPASDAPVAVFWSYLPKTPRLHHLLRAHPAFANRSPEQVVGDMLARHFTPNARVRGEVDKLFAGRTRPVIGVHIRYTDMKVPLGKYVAAIGQLRQRMPEAPIFLATDHAEPQALIQSRFGNVFEIEKLVATDNAGLHRPDQRGGATIANAQHEAENALIDMWALSRCDWLVHASRSTFSVLAAKLGGIPAERQIDIDRLNVYENVKNWIYARL